MAAFWRLSLAKSALVAGGEISPSELAEAALTHLEDLGPLLDNCITIVSEAARASAVIATMEIAGGCSLTR